MNLLFRQTVAPFRVSDPKFTKYSFTARAVGDNAEETSRETNECIAPM